MMRVRAVGSENRTTRVQKRRRCNVDARSFMYISEIVVAR